MGTSAAPGLQALGGNDRISAGVGDTVDGGPGLDTVVLSGFGWLAPRPSGAGWVVDNVSGGQVTLVNVERLQTSPAEMLALDVDGTSGVVYRIYQAAFARTPDKGGVSFWINEMDNGMTLRDVASGFVASEEFQAVYGSNPTKTQLVEQLYMNVLGRPAEKAGIDFWVGQLDAGATVPAVLASISESSENKDRVASIIGSTGIELDAFAFIL